MHSIYFYSLTVLNDCSEDMANNTHIHSIYFYSLKVLNDCYEDMAENGNDVYNIS